MAGQTEVTFSEMQSAIDELTTLNEQFGRKVSELESLQQELTASWDGQANDAFDQAFQTDKGKWTEFQTLVSQYVSGLQQIRQAYVTAEGVNTGTAQTRSY